MNDGIQSFRIEVPQADLDYLHDIGELNINISGCMNSCGHHHAGHIGILGVDKDGEEWYQVSVGGADGSDARAAKPASAVLRSSASDATSARQNRASRRYGLSGYSSISRSKVRATV